MKKIAILLVLTSSLVLSCISTIFTNKAYAASPCLKTNASGNPDSKCLPAWVVTDINYHCNTDHWGIVSDSWFSPVGNPSSTTVNVSQGDSSVDLDVNYIFYRCVVNPSTYFKFNENGVSEKNYFSVDTKNDGTIASLPASFEGTYPSPLKAKTYNQGVIKTVKYSPSTPFQINSTKHIYLDSRGYFTDAISSEFVSYCSWVTAPAVLLNNGISGTGNRTPTKDASNCATQIADFSINVVITSINVQGTIYGPSGKITSRISLPAGSSSDLYNKSLTPRGTCSGASTKTDTAGAFTFNEKIGTGFCIRPPLTFKDSSNIFYSNLVITPYVAGDKNPPSSPYFGGCNISTGYELQSAQIKNSNSSCSYVPPKINSNSGYDFLYQKAQRADIAATTSVSLLKAYPGDSVTFKSTAADSNTLPDDGTDTYSYSVVTSTTAGPSDTAFNGANCSASNTIGLLPEGSHSRNCSITIPASSTAGTQYCITTTISNQPTYASVTGSPAQACVVVVQKPSIVVTGVVNGVSSAPAEHEIGSASDVTMRVAISCNDFIGTISYSVTSLPSIYSSNSTYACTAASPAVSNIPITISAATLNANDPNTYVFTTSITAAAGVPLPLPSSTTTLRNYTVPYARFYGNDIASGSGSIYFNNLDNQPLTTSSSSAGSAAEYAAIAKTTILIATAAFSSTAPASPIGLSALTSAQVAIASTNSTSGAKWLGDWSTSGYYGDINGTTTISGASSIASKITIVGKDIYITGNITIDENKLPYTVKPFNNASIPVITLIADNNIYIDPSVTQIDALLQAGNDIYTCSTSTGPAATPSSVCKNTLLVNGEVGAKNKIHFDRVCGTRLYALSTEVSTTHATYIPTNENPSCSGNYKSGVAAEVINFPSYLYFASPYVSGATQTQYQSIYSAPPLL